MRRSKQAALEAKRPRLTSLLLVEEKLVEAKYFIGRMIRCRHHEYFAFDLNAFLSASRSVAFLIRKEFGRVPGFRDWWSDYDLRMNEEPATAFFRDLRNFSQKEGRVRLVGHGRWIVKAKRSRFEYEFVSGTVQVPESLKGRDVVEACRTHLGRMASLALDAALAFPFHACPLNALTVEGVAALSLDLDEVDELLGLPRGWTNLDREWPMEDRLQLLRRQVDGVDFGAIRTLARFESRKAPLTTGMDDMEAALAARWLQMLQTLNR